MPSPQSEAGAPSGWRRLWPVLIWGLAMVVALVVTVRSRYVADLSAFLPEAPTPEQRVLLDQLRDGATSRLILIGLTVQAEASPTEAALAASTRLSRELGAALRRDPRFEVVHNGDLAASEAVGRFLYAHRYRFSPAIEPARFTEQGLRDAIDDTLLLLGTPAGRLVKPLLFEDPTGESVRMAQAMTPATAPASRDGVWVSRDGRRAVLLAFTRADGADMDGQAAAVGAVRDAFERLAHPLPAAQRPRLELSGPGVMGMQSRQMIEQEVDHLAKLGTAIMVGLLLLSFGSLRALSVALLPVASGVLAGIASVSLIFGEVHGFTLGFGTTLIGEAVDYAIYYLIQAGVIQGADGGARGWLRRSWPTVRLGLWTSLAGFAALAASGFGGLAQLGVFSMAGLAGAALTTRWVLTRLAPQGATGRGMRPAMGRFMQTMLKVWPRTRALWWLALVAAVIWTVVRPSPWTGNLSTMSTISAKDSALDEALRADLGAADGGVLLAVQAPSEAEVLVRAEAVGRRLDTLVSEGRLVGYDSPARWLPSPVTQQQRRASLPAPEVLRARLQAATAGGALPASRLEAFVDAVSAQREAPLLDWAALQSTPLAPMLNAQMLPARTEAGTGRQTPWTVLLNLHLPEGADEATIARVADALQAAVKDVPEVRLVRINAELNALYGHYLHEAGWQAGAGAVLVVLLLAWHLRSARRLWNVVLPLLVSGLLVHTGLALADARLGILHLVGFLLVAAVGSNYALFFDHLQEGGGDASQDEDPDTLASLLLANLTTVLSFGLLALSDMPALAAIGQVVAPGALLSLWMAAAFVACPDRSSKAASA